MEQGQGQTPKQKQKHKEPKLREQQQCQLMQKTIEVQTIVHQVVEVEVKRVEQVIQEVTQS